MIVQHVLGTNFPKDPNEIIRICNGKKSWKALESKIVRDGHAICIRWSEFIYPTILSYLSGTVKLDWKRDFFQFIIDQKYIGVTDIDKNIVAEKWPSIPIYKLLVSAKYFSKNHGNKGVPLYQSISENLHKLTTRKEVPQSKLDLIDAFEMLRNGD